MSDLNDYAYFVHVVEKEGFAAAARDLAVPKSRLSRHISQLESRIGARLIQRSSRHFSVTEIGESFYQHARAMLNEVEAAEAMVKRKTNELSGRVRFSCSIGVAQFASCKVIGRFMLENPKVNVVQQVTNETVHLLEAGIDLAVRAHINELPDSGLIQKHLGTAHWILVAGSRYVEKNGSPSSVDDLNKHVGMKLGWRPEAGVWSLKNKENEEAQISFTPQFCCDDMTSLKLAAMEGNGIVALPAYVCRDELASGELVHVLPNWHAGLAKFTLLRTNRKGIQPAVQAFADFLIKHIPALVK